MSYVPPYTISEKVVSLVAEIAAALERYKIVMEGADGVRLRKVNHVRTIRGTTAIEGNALTEEQVTAVLEGRHVVAPRREIEEIKGAHAAYSLLGEVDPLNLKDILTVHASMMGGLVEGAGGLRNQGVGVVDARGNVLHMAPPASRVSELLGDLLEWASTSAAHPLIMSSVFHYEFEFIHPFLDGNGRMGRFLQTALLGRWNELFFAAPIENIVFNNQAEYYRAIERSTAKADSGPFIDFMLERILETIKEKGVPKTAVGRLLSDSSNGLLNGALNGPLNNLMAFITQHGGIQRSEIVKSLGIPERTASRYLSQLIAEGKIEHRGSKKTGGYYAV